MLDRAATELRNISPARDDLRCAGVARRHPNSRKSVWANLAELAFGEVTSYGELGGDRPGHLRSHDPVRRRGEPVPIIVPCPRVLASDHRVTGYSGGNGASPTKVWLSLDHEGIVHAS